MNVHPEVVYMVITVTTSFTIGFVTTHFSLKYLDKVYQQQIDKARLDGIEEGKRLAEIDYLKQALAGKKSKANEYIDLVRGIESINPNLSTGPKQKT